MSDKRSTTDERGAAPIWGLDVRWCPKGSALATRSACAASEWTSWRVHDARDTEEESMKVSELMTKNAVTCHPEEPLYRAAQIMWDNDCGCVPVVDGSSKIQGMITDRDVCMAALMEGKTLGEIPITRAMSRAIYACSPDDDVERAAELMRVRRVRRVPVIDPQGEVVGVVSLGDLARALSNTTVSGVTTPTVARTLYDISQPGA
jgi:CBS domain-containing protein